MSEIRRRILRHDLQESIEHPERALVNIKQVELELAGKQVLDRFRIETAFFPDRFEAGTQNMAGIFGLNASLKNHTPKKFTDKRFHELVNQLSDDSRFKILKAVNPEKQGYLFSLVHHQTDHVQLAQQLFDDYQIECRVGLFCAPLAHQFLGTEKTGAIRFSLSHFHHDSDIDYLYNAIQKVF